MAHELLRQQVALQRGCVTLAQAIALGVPERTLLSRVRRGDVERPFRGAYLLPPMPDRSDALRAAAALSIRADARVSHASAARWHRLDGAPEETAFQVSVGYPCRAETPAGVALLRTSSPEFIWTPQAPVTSVARTLVDLAPRVSRARLRVLTGDALRRGLTTIDDIVAAVAAAGPRCGAGPLLRELESLNPRLDSGFEQRFFDWVDTTDLPRPEAQVLVEDGFGWYCHLDAAWRRAKLGVETDGFATHGARSAFIADRRRDRRVAVLGWLIVRITDDDMNHRSDELYGQLRTLLDARMAA